MDLPDKFDAVLLASRLLNLVPAAIRRRYLRACRRHLRDDGILIAQLHDPALFDAAPFERRSGDRVFAVHDVRIFDDGRVSSTLITRIGEQQWLQGITVWRFDEAELDGMLAAEGLRRMRYLDEAGSWGLGVVQVDDEDEETLRAFAAGDPAVTSGTAALEMGKMLTGFVRPR